MKGLTKMVIVGILLSILALWKEFSAKLGQPLLVEYNHNRIHSALGYLTPAEFEAQYEAHK